MYKKHGSGLLRRVELEVGQQHIERREDGEKKRGRRGRGETDHERLPHALPFYVQSPGFGTSETRTNMERAKRPVKAKRQPKIAKNNSGGICLRSRLRY